MQLIIAIRTRTVRKNGESGGFGSRFQDRCGRIARNDGLLGPDRWILDLPTYI